MLPEIHATGDTIEVLLVPENPLDVATLAELGKTETGTVVVSHTDRGLLLKKARTSSTRETTLIPTNGKAASR